MLKTAWAGGGTARSSDCAKSVGGNEHGALSGGLPSLGHKGSLPGPHRRPGSPRLPIPRMPPPRLHHHDCSPHPALVRKDVLMSEPWPPEYRATARSQGQLGPRAGPTQPAARWGPQPLLGPCSSMYTQRHISAMIKPLTRSEPGVLSG